MADDIEPPREIGDDELTPEAPEYLESNRSIWDAATTAELKGASRQERDILAQQIYEGYGYHPGANKNDVRRARRDADAAMKFFGVRFDWALWRREMESQSG